jgi:hypothetical protein
MDIVAVDMRQQSHKKKYATLGEYCLESKKARVRLAVELGVSRFQMAGLLYPDRYPVPALTDDLVQRIASLLNQSASHVRNLYPRKAA